MMEEHTQSQTQYRRRFRNYLIDRNLQLRYTLVIVLTSAVLTAGLGYFWYGEMREASQLIEIRSLGSLSVQQVREIEQDLAAEDTKRLLVLVGFGVMLALILTVYGIIFTHKVAGPLFKVQQHLRLIRDNRLEPVYELRKGDQLRAFFVHFQQMHEALRQRTDHEIAILEGVLEKLGQGDSDAERAVPAVAAAEDPIESLRTLLRRKQGSIRPAEPTKEESV